MSDPGEGIEGVGAVSTEGCAVPPRRIPFMTQRVSGPEFARLSSLYRYGVLDTAPEPAIDQALQGLAARLDVPVAQLVFADAQRFWAKSTIGAVEPLQLRGRGLLDGLMAQGPAFLAVAELGIGDMPAVPAARSFAGLRINSAEDEALGILYVADARPRDFAAEAAEALAMAAAAIRTILDSGRRGREDEATGALRREPFLDQADRLIAVTRMARQSISLVTLDVAPFRLALDGKAAGLGSLALRHMAELGRTQVRGRDSFGRLDDDLFAVLLTDTAEAGAQVLARRLSRHLERGWTDAGLIPEGLALGSASLKPAGPQETAEALVARATAARETLVATRVA
ncbi:MAG: diguanylate cyclase [Caulobacteraceae bacterium]|nr:diguanylate cyclase [Caulobacter sp.]